MAAVWLCVSSGNKVQIPIQDSKILPVFLLHIWIVILLCTCVVTV